MAYSINKVILVGNITNDLVLKKTNNGTSVLNFGLATNKSIKKGDSYEDVATFHNINAWAHLAEFCAKYLQKGDRITVIGHLEYDKWEKDGAKFEKAKIVISELVPMTRKKDGNGATEEQAREALGADLIDSQDITDEIPF